MYVCFNEVDLGASIPFLLALLISMIGYFLLFKINTYIFPKGTERNTTGKIALLIVSIALYTGTIYIFSKCINAFFPLYETINDLIQGNLKPSLLLQGPPIQVLKTLGAYLGVFLFFLNLMPLGGLNGFKILDIIYTSFTGGKIPERFLIPITFISTSVIFFAFGWVVYHLIF